MIGKIDKWKDNRWNEVQNEGEWFEWETNTCNKFHANHRRHLDDKR